MIKGRKKRKEACFLRRIVVLFISIMLIFSFSIPVLGTNEATEMSVDANVQSDKSCFVKITAVLNVDFNDGKLRFPIPEDATDVFLNGTRVKPEMDRQAQYIDLSESLNNMTGTFTVKIEFTLPNVIQTGAAGTPELQLPLLYGYEYPVSSMDFTVRLPGTITAKPAFSSGYHKANIEKDLTSFVEDNTVTGSANKELKDHETLTMTLAVEEAWFPNAPLEFFESAVDDIAMVICAVLALLYWLFFLRSVPPARRSSATAPEGVTAGQLGAVMTLGKANLTLMVFSWAKLGYIQIETQKKRVLLHKRMDMGNERSAFEQKAFRKLFGKRSVINTAGAGYAAKQREVARMAPGLQSLVHPRSGNPRLFRALAALIGLFGGVSFGIAITQEAVIQSVWIFLTAALGLVCGWYMQAPIRELYLRKSHKTAVGILFTVIWLIMGFVCNQPLVTLLVMVAQWIAGFMAFYCGKRTEAGRQDYAQIMGLRHYLKTVTKEELRELQKMDPEYFHTLAPCALALGLCHSFALRFGKERIADCPYITAAPGKTHTAREWAETMSRTVYLMNLRSRLRPLEHLAKHLPGGKG